MELAFQYYKLGLEKNKSGEYEEAMAEYTRAIEAMPDFFEAYLRRGTLGYRILKRYEDALTDFDRAVELNGESALAFLHRGIVKCHLLRFQDALPDLDKAIELDPNDERAYLNRGKDKFILKYSKEEVCHDLERAVRLGSTQAGDMIDLFYSPGSESNREIMNTGMKERARKLKEQKVKS